VKENVEKLVIIILTLVLFSLIIFSVFSFIRKRESEKVQIVYNVENKEVIYEQGVSDSIIGAIDTKIEQKINVKDKYINTIGIKFATYDRINDAIYRFVIKKGDEFIVNYEFNSKDVKNSEYTYFQFNDILIDDDYVFIIEALSISANNIITAYENSSTNELTYILYK